MSETLERQPVVKTIYQGEYTSDLGIVLEGDLLGWLVYRHPDGQWVTLADLREHLDVINPGYPEPEPETESPATKEDGA